MLLLSIILLVASTAQSPAEKGYIPTPDGTRLFYQKVGTGSQVVIIPLGFLLYKDFLYLANEDRTIIFYDVRNRGRSDAIVNSKLIGLLHDVEDIETVRKHFGFQQFSAIGYSYLGKVVVLYGLTYPGHLERIIQLGPVPLKFGTEYPAEFQANDSDAVLNKDELQKLRDLRKEGFDKKHPKEYCEMEWRLTRLQLLGNPANAGKIVEN